MMTKPVMMTDESALLELAVLSPLPLAESESQREREEQKDLIVCGRITQ